MNTRHMDYDSTALTPELHRHDKEFRVDNNRWRIWPIFLFFVKCMTQQFQQPAFISKTKVALSPKTGVIWGVN